MTNTTSRVPGCDEAAPTQEKNQPQDNFCDQGGTAGKRVSQSLLLLLMREAQNRLLLPANELLNGLRNRGGKDNEPDERKKKFAYSLVGHARQNYLLGARKYHPRPPPGHNKKTKDEKQTGARDDEDRPSVQPPVRILRQRGWPEHEIVENCREAEDSDEEDAQLG